MIGKIKKTNDYNIMCIQSPEYINQVYLFINSKFSNSINIQKKILKNMVYTLLIRGIQGVSDIEVSTEGGLRYLDGELKYHNEYYLEAEGNNLPGLFKNENVDSVRTISNDIIEVSRILGIEAARELIISELRQVYEAKSAVINISHYEIVADYMTRTGEVKGMNRYGMKINNGGIVSKAAFEQQTESLVESATSGEFDNIGSVAANLFFGQGFKGGTSSSNLLVSENTGTINVNKLLENI